MAEVAADQNNTNGRKGAVQDVEPTDEVPVKPDGRDCSDDTGNQNHSFLGKSEDVREAKTRGVKGIVVGGPDVQSEDEDGDIEQVEVEHNLEDVVTTSVDAGDSAEEEHQGVSDEEGHHCDNQADLRSFGETGEVGCKKKLMNDDDFFVCIDESALLPAGRILENYKLKLCYLALELPDVDRSSGGYKEVFLKSDVVLVNLNYSDSSVGTGMEISLANELKIPIIGFGNEEIYDWVIDCCDVVLDNLEEIILSDVYTGDQIEKTKKSVCYSLKLRDFEKTLTDDDISIIINNILEKLKTINVYIRPF